jgi:hypothetical protein
MGGTIPCPDGARERESLMVRRAIPLVTALIASVIVVSASAPTVNAVGGCVLHAPSRVAIGRPYVAITLKMSGDCVYGSWYLYHSTQGFQGVAIFNNKRTDIRDVYSSHTVGFHTWRAGSAWNAADVDRPQNSSYCDVRLAAAASISSARSGGVVTLTGTSLLYSVSSNGYFRRSAAGMFQSRERGTTTWKNLKSVRTNSAGVVSMSYRYPRLRDYRFTLYSTTISWDLGSAVTTR